MFEALFAFKVHGKQPLHPPIFLNTCLDFFSLPYWSLAFAMTIPSWQQPEISSGQIPASRPLVTQQNWRISGAASGLERHRPSGQSWGNQDKVSATSHRNLAFPQLWTNVVALKQSGISQFWESDYQRHMKYQTERLNKANSSSVAFLLTQEYLPNHHPGSDFAVCCSCFKCTFNSDNVTCKMNSWDQDQVLMKTTRPSG